MGLAARQPLRFVVFSDEPADQALLRTGMVTFADRPPIDLATDTFAAYGCSMTIVAFGSGLRPGALLQLASLAPGPCFVDREDVLGILSRSRGDTTTVDLRESSSLHDSLWGFFASLSVVARTSASYPAAQIAEIQEELDLS